MMVVDDEEMLRELLAEQLHEAGYSVLVAANGDEALALLAAGKRSTSSFGPFHAGYERHRPHSRGA